MKTVLYVTYNGVLEPIGQAQVLQYLEQLSAEVRIILLSFEKGSDWSMTGHRAEIEQRIEEAGVVWHPQFFHRKPKYIAKLRDTLTLQRAALKLARRYSVDFLHCRSYVASQAGVAVFRRLGTPFIFDMRGFWVDERREGGRWNCRNPLFAILYALWKKKERLFIGKAHEIVVLTEQAKAVVERHPSYRRQPISIIPCSVDHTFFDIPADETRSAVRSELGLDEDAYVVVYLGSIGTIYKLEDMFRAFVVIKRKRPDARLLMIGRYAKGAFDTALAEVPRMMPEDIVKTATTHREVPRYLGAADIAIAFREANFSALGASPTKLAEYFACGLPVIANAGVGDVERIVTEVGGGHVVDAPLSEKSIGSIGPALDAIDGRDRLAIRERSRLIHDLDRATADYREIYERMTPQADSATEARRG